MSFEDVRHVEVKMLLHSPPESISLIDKPSTGGNDFKSVKYDGPDRNLTLGIVSIDAVLEETGQTLLCSALQFASSCYKGQCQ